MKSGHSREQLLKKVLGILSVNETDILEFEIVRQSIDARKKPDIYYIYTVELSVKQEEKIYRAVLRKKCIKEQISREEKIKYSFPSSGNKVQKHPTVIVGAGPAGLFCAYFLALHGYRPILLERGKSVEERTRDVEEFWRTGKLNPASNVQFGEGGAGTFSDGKLNTLVKDRMGVIEPF